jgi:hypothetical protein
MDKSKLIGKRADPTAVEVDVEGGKVKVRPLTRGEVLILRGLGEDPAKFERKLLAFAMVEPELTEAEVGQWQKNSPALEIEDVTDKVMDISGLKERAEKDAYKSAGDEQ